MCLSPLEAASRGYDWNCALYIGRGHQDQCIPDWKSWLGDEGIIGAGPYGNDANLIIVYEDNKYKLVDWAKVYSEIMGKASPRQPDSDTMSAGIQVGSLLLVSFVAALSCLASLGGAAVPAVALAVGGVSAVGGILAWASSPGGAAPPAPPDILQISAAVRNIVAEELDKTAAEQAATQFAKAAGWLLWTGTTFRAQLRADGAVDMSPHDIKDFGHDLEDFRRGDFQTHLLHMKMHPEQAKYIIPALLMGVAAQLQIQWLHALLRQADEPRRLAITAAQIEEFMREVDSCRSALQDARAELTDYCDREVRKHGLATVPLARGWIGKELTKALTGNDSTDFLNEPLTILQRVTDKCEQDKVAIENGGTPSYFLKKEWYPVLPSPPAA